MARRISLHSPFGLGNATTAHIEIEWPSGKKQTIDGVKSDQLLLLDEADAKR